MGVGLTSSHHTFTRTQLGKANYPFLQVIKMAATPLPPPQASYYSLVTKRRILVGFPRQEDRIFSSANRYSILRVSAISQGGSDDSRPRTPPGVDTRIHWDSPDEGWVGGSDGGDSQSSRKLNPEEEQKNLLRERFSDLLNDSSDSHYQFLGVSAEADLEEIKSAYRRLSKEYHPDTTSLPVKTASDKFLKLREVYAVLSNDETRRFYDWTLAQEVASRQAQQLRMRLEDPYEQDLENYVPVPDMVDRLGGKNLPLSEQAMTALTIDIFIIIFAICSIIYVLLFKEPF